MNFSIEMNKLDTQIKVHNVKRTSHTQKIQEVIKLIDKDFAIMKFYKYLWLLELFVMLFIYMFLYPASKSVVLFIFVQHSVYYKSNYAFANITLGAKLTNEFCETEIWQNDRIYMSFTL